MFHSHYVRVVSFPRHSKMLAKNREFSYRSCI